MSTFGRAIDPRASFSDEAIERGLAALRARIEPDPLFRRRLRSQAVNRFVAVREGIGVTAPERSTPRMMGRLGRACLYATFTLGVSAASVLAASQEALPGETLYGLKLRIEQVRMEVLPAHLHEQLAAYALTERIDEMARLADAGLVEQAIAMAPQIAAGFEQLMALQESTDAVSATEGIERQLVVVEALIAQLPPDAQIAVAEAIEGGRGLRVGQAASARDGGNAYGHDADPKVDPKPTGGGGSAPLDDGASAGDVEATPELSTKPLKTPKPEPTATPTPSPEVTPSAKKAGGADPDGGSQD